MACGAREVHRRGRRLHGDLRPRRDPPPQRPLRREARPRAGGRDRRPAEARSSLGAHYQQEVDLQVLFKDVSRVRPGLHGARARRATSSTARSGSRSTSAASARSSSRTTSQSWTRSTRRRASTAPSTRASATRGRASCRNRRHRARRRDPQRGREGRDARRPGRRAAPREEVIEVADLLGAGVAKALLGKDVLADDLPYVTGAIGLLGTIPSYEMIEGCDTLLMVGTSFPYAEFLPKEGQARVRRDRHRGRHDRHPLPGRRASCRRREGDAAGARPAPRAQGGPRAGASRSRAGRGLVGASSRPRDDGRPTR